MELSRDFMFTRIGASAGGGAPRPGKWAPESGHVYKHGK